MAISRNPGEAMDSVNGADTKRVLQTVGVKIKKEAANQAVPAKRSKTMDDYIEENNLLRAELAKKDAKIQSLESLNRTLSDQIGALAQELAEHGPKTATVQKKTPLCPWH